LAGSDAVATIDRRQAEARGDVEDGRANAAPPSDHRRQRRRQTGVAARSSQRIVAGTNAGAQAAHAGDGGAGQQNGANRLGPSGEGRKLPSSGGGRGVKPGSTSEA